MFKKTTEKRENCILIGRREVHKLSVCFNRGNQMIIIAVSDTGRNTVGHIRKPKGKSIMRK